MIQLLNEPLDLGQHSVRVGASVGIAVFPEDAREIESLCVAADLRMYDAKYDSGSRRGESRVLASHPPAEVESDEPASVQVVD